MRSLLPVALVVIASAAAVVLLPSIANGEPTATTAAERVYVSINAGGSILRSRPHGIHLLSNENLAGLHWSRWGSITANARGFDYGNSPSPGHRRKNPVRVQLTGRRRCDGILVYTKVRIRFTHGVPYAGQPTLVTYPFGCPQ